MKRKTSLTFSLLLFLLSIFLLPDQNVLPQKAHASTFVQIPKHGVAAVYTAADIDKAHTFGFEYVLPYYAGIGETPTDVNSDYGKALIRNNMKVIVDVTNYGPPNSRPWLYDCVNGKIVPDLNFLTRMINKNKNSPLTLGYWIKDDDYHICADNTMSNAMKQVYQTIKTLDPNPNHYAIAGFGGAYSIKANYQPGETDIIGYYPFRAWNRSDYVCNGAGTDRQIMDCEISQLNSLLKARTPTGQTPPPWIDLYQAYYTNTIEPPAELTYDVQQAISGGAVSLLAFAWDTASGVDHVIKNDTGLQGEVTMINNLSKTITGGSGGSSGGSCTHGACSNCVDTCVGKPNCTSTCATGTTGGAGGGTNNTIANYADALAKSIDSHCPASNIPVRGYAYVTSHTEGCLDAVLPDLAKITQKPATPNDVIAALTKSTNDNNGFLQCVGFVVAVTTGINKPLPTLNARDYNRDFPGYKWYPADTQPMQSGDIVVYTGSGGLNQHIDIVIAPPNADKSFKVAEANGGTGTVGEETYPYGNNPYHLNLTYLGFLRAQ